MTEAYSPCPERDRCFAYNLDKSRLSRDPVHLLSHDFIAQVCEGGLRDAYMRCPILAMSLMLRHTPAIVGILNKLSLELPPEDITKALLLFEESVKAVLSSKKPD